MADASPHDKCIARGINSYGMSRICAAANLTSQVGCVEQILSGRVKLGDEFLTFRSSWLASDQAMAESSTAFLQLHKWNRKRDGYTIGRVVARATEIGARRQNGIDGQRRMMIVASDLESDLVVTEQGKMAGDRLSAFRGVLIERGCFLNQVAAGRMQEKVSATIQPHSLCVGNAKRITLDEAPG